MGSGQEGGEGRARPKRFKNPASEARDRVLRRLIDPPLVVAIGPPNIGKSSLLNALAGRSVALVADEAGTTRDHVGGDAGISQGWLCGTSIRRALLRSMLL